MKLRGMFRLKRKERKPLRWGGKYAVVKKTHGNGKVLYYFAVWSDDHSEWHYPSAVKGSTGATVSNGFHEVATAEAVAQHNYDWSVVKTETEIM